MRPSEQRLGTFRKNIRRGQIQSLFAATRIQLLEELSHAQIVGHQIEMELKELKGINPKHLTVEELRRIARVVQNQAGIRGVQKMQCQPHLVKYLSIDYLNHDQQFYVSFILANMYYLSINCPSQELTKKVMKLLEEGDMRMLENIFLFIGNAANHYPQWLKILMNHYQLGQTLSHLFQRFPKPTIRYCQHLVQLVFKVIVKTGKHSTFLNLGKHLMKMVMQNQNQEVKDLMIKGAYAYWSLLKNFPQELTPSFLKYGTLSRLIFLLPFFNNRKIVHLVFQCINLTFNDITDMYFQNQIIPFLIQLMGVNFQCGEPDKVYSTRSFKLQSYRLINRALQNEKLTATHFSSLKLAQTMIDDFQTSEDPDVLVDLSYIFVFVAMNTNNERLKEVLKKLLQKAIKYNPNSYEFAVFLHQFQNTPM